MTWIAWSAVIRSRHLPVPSPRAPVRVSSPASGVVSRFQLLRRHHARLARLEDEGGFIRFPARVVDADDGDVGRTAIGSRTHRMDQAKHAHLAAVCARVERGDPMLPAVVGRQVAHAGHEAVSGANVGQHLHRRVPGRDLEIPVARSGTDARDAFRLIAHLQVAGVEMHGLPWGKRQSSGAVPHAGIVNGGDTQAGGLGGMVHDADEPLQTGVGSGHQQRDGGTPEASPSRWSV